MKTKIKVCKKCGEQKQKDFEFCKFCGYGKGFKDKRKKPFKDVEITIKPDFDELFNEMKTQLIEAVATRVENRIQDTLDDIDSRLDNLKNDIEDVEGKVNDIEDYENRISDLECSLEDKADSDDVNSLENDVEELKDKVDELDG